MIEIILSVEQRASLGSVVAESSRLEEFLDSMIQHLTNLNATQYEILLQGKMLNAKLAILKQIGLQKIRSKKRAKTFSETVDKLSSLNADRVTAVHGVWGPKDRLFSLHDLFSGKLIPGPKEAVLKRNGAKSKTLNAEKLDDIAEGIRATHQKLFRFWMETWVKSSARRSIRREKNAKSIKLRNTKRAD